MFKMEQMGQVLEPGIYCYFVIMFTCFVKLLHFALKLRSLFEDSDCIRECTMKVRRYFKRSNFLDCEQLCL